MIKTIKLNEYLSLNKDFFCGGNNSIIIMAIIQSPIFSLLSKIL